MRKLAYLTLAAGIFAGTAMWAAPVRPVALDAKVAELTKQLTGTNARDRETAAKELETIGEPALKAVTELTKSENAEVAKLAKELKSKIEASMSGKQILAPTYVELNFKDTTVAKVLEEFNKQSKYNIVIAGATDKINEKKITIDTAGKVAFWKALDLFCEKAGLIESDGISGETAPVGPGGPIRIQPFPGGGIQIQPRIIQIVPAPAIDIAPEKPVDDEKPVEKPAKPAVKPAVKPAPAIRPAVVRPAAGFQAVQIQIAPAIEVVPPIAVPLPPAGGGAMPGAPGIAFPGAPPFPGGVGGVAGKPTIVLTEGKAVELAKDYQGAIRVRSLPPSYAQNFRGIVVPDALGIPVQFQAEPKLQINNVTGIKITKAVDDNDQTLKNFEPKAGEGAGGGAIDLPLPIKPGGPAIGGPAVGRPIGRPVPFYGNGIFVAQVTKGEKESTSLKELTGTATLKILTEPEVFVTVDNINKAKGGDAVKGKANSTLKVTEVKKQANGTYAISFELTHEGNDLQLTGKQIMLDAEDLKLLGTEVPGIKPVPLPGGGVRPVPLPAPAPDVKPLPAPVPPVRGDKAPAAPMADFEDVKVAPPAGGAAPAVPPVAPPAGGGIGIGIAPAIPPIGAPVAVGRGVYDLFNLTLSDEKGKAYKLIASNLGGTRAEKKEVDGKIVISYTRTATVIFRPTEKDQAEPTKLTASAASLQDVEVPFTLKNVKLK